MIVVKNIKVFSFSVCRKISFLYREVYLVSLPVKSSLIGEFYRIHTPPFYLLSEQNPVLISVGTVPTIFIYHSGETHET